MRTVRYATIKCDQVTEGLSLFLSHLKLMRKDSQALHMYAPEFVDKAEKRDQDAQRTGYSSTLKMTQGCISSQGPGKGAAWKPKMTFWR